MKKRHKLGLLFVATLISFSAYFLSKDISLLKSFGYFGIFVINLIAASTIFLPAPSFLAVIAAGMFLNPFLVALFSAFGASIGELTGYMAGTGGEEFIENKKWYKKVRLWMDKNGIITLFILAAVPNPFFDMAGMIAGATNISVKKYLLVVFAGKFVKFLMFANLGVSSIGFINKLI